MRTDHDGARAQISAKHKRPRRPLAEELAHDAVAHVKAAPGDRVEMVFRLRLPKSVAEALTARAVREEAVELEVRAALGGLDMGGPFSAAVSTPLTDRFGFVS